MRARIAFLLLASMYLVLVPRGEAQKKSVATKKPAERPRRLYFGAPPAAPHEIGGDFSQCLACHGEQGGAGPVTPHPTRVLCQQCHVAAPEQATKFRGSRFVGLTRPGRAPRIQPKGPPLIPHAVLLRENCLACHALGAREDVLATTHPERLRCQQCHIPQIADSKPGR